ncbi:MAG: hypothetical protein CL933_04855 [Deltaproteobacteria bacterium]|nr:hypothetical protein [Deltaproteobacteria bacterium]
MSICERAPHFEGFFKNAPVGRSAPNRRQAIAPEYPRRGQYERAANGCRKTPERIIRRGPVGSAATDRCPLSRPARHRIEVSRRVAASRNAN